MSGKAACLPRPGFVPAPLFRALKLRLPDCLKLDQESGSFEDVTQAGADTSALVMRNPAHFDPKLPRSAVQLMVDLSGLNLDHPAARGGDAFDSTCLTRMIVEKVDWTAVAGTGLR